MRELVKRNLPFVSAASLLVAVICLVVVARQRRQFLTDTGETTRTVEAAVAEIQNHIFMTDVIKQMKLLW